MKKIFFIAAFVAGIALQAQVSTTRINDVKLGMKLQKYMQFQGKSGEIYKTVVKVWMLHCSFKL